MGQHIKQVFLILLAILVVIPLGALRFKPVPDDRKVNHPYVENTNAPFAQIASIDVSNNQTVVTFGMMLSQGLLERTHKVVLMDMDTGETYKFKYDVGFDEKTMRIKDGVMYASWVFKKIPLRTNRIAIIQTDGAQYFFSGIDLSRHNTASSHERDKHGLTIPPPVATVTPERFIPPGQEGFPTGNDVRYSDGRFTKSDNPPTDRDNALGGNTEMDDDVTGLGSLLGGLSTAVRGGLGDPTANIKPQTKNQAQTNHDLHTSDLSFYELHGNVRSCTLQAYTMYAEVIEFTRDGKLATSLVRRVSRNNKGQIVLLTDTEPCEMDGEYYSTAYEWDAYGRLAKEIEDTPEGTTTTVYRYDSKGNVIEKRTTGFSGDDVNWLERFTYKAFDENGNWTVREKTWQDIGFNSEAVQETEKRIITYY